MVHLAGVAFVGEQITEDGYSMAACFSAEIVSGVEDFRDDPSQAVKEQYAGRRQTRPST